MRVLLLGTAAGGGVPQWNCSCAICREARSGTRVRARTQDSVAISADGERWFLLNASPDVMRQIRDNPALWPSSHAPHEANRGSPIAGVVVTNGDLDHCLGLLCLREWTSYALVATPYTFAGLVEHNVMFRTLRRQARHMLHRPLRLGSSTPLLDRDERETGLTVRAFAVEGKVPLHLEGLVPPDAEGNVGLLVDDTRTGARLAYVPGAGALDGIEEQLDGADCVLFDGTFWSDDELVCQGLPGRTARALAHVPVGGAQGSLERLRSLRAPRRYYTHVNNTNPMLLDGSPERRAVEAAGWAVAEDGEELRL